MPLYRLGDHTPVREGEVWLAPSADVIGRVTLGHEVGVWFNATIRGDEEDIFVGAGSNIQDGAVLHADKGFPTRVGRNVTVGHQAILHGCTIGDGALIGMRATIMNGAVIGAQSIVGAGALITEGKTFPDRSLIVGAPARALRILPDEAVEALAKAAPSYIAEWRRYAAGLAVVEG
jgi:carbonic anhydrase/acetyltransferase-like protein (isoleucine patch superfamily)